MPRKISKIISIIIVLLVSSLSSAFSQQWQKLSGGLNNEPTRLIIDSSNNILYAYGNFNVADTIPVCYNAKWNGVKWDSLTNVCGSMSGNVFIYRDSLYLNAGKKMYKWHGANWVKFANFTWGGIVNTLANGNNLYVFGSFDSIVSGVHASKIAKWDGHSWSPLDTIKWYGGVMKCAKFYKGNLYVGGNMINKDKSIDNLAMWNGSKWLPVGNNEMTSGWGAVNDFEIFNDELYVAGVFTKAAGNPGNSIAKWDGVTWDDVGGGMTSNNAQIYDLQVYNGELYACGQFKKAGGVPSIGIAKWNGLEWCSLGQTPAFGLDFLAMAVYNNELIVGGTFITLNGDTVNHIAKWMGGNYIDTCGTLSAIKEFNPFKSIHIYPNPALNSINIEFEVRKKQPLQIELYNSLGQIMHKEECDNFSGMYKNQINISDLADGIYLLQVKVNGESLSQKFVKQQ